MGNIKHIVLRTIRSARRGIGYFARFINRGLKILVHTAGRSSKAAIKSILKTLKNMFKLLARLVRGFGVRISKTKFFRGLVSLLKRFASTKVGKFISLLIVKAHYHSAKRPHNYLMKKSRHYERWHNWDHHPKVHFAVAALFLVVFVGFNMRAFAIDTEFTWSFETPGNYTFDNTKIEPNNDKLRLSLRDAVKNFSVADGQLQSDTVLDVAADNTYYYVSNSLGIDVIRQDTWERTAFVTSGGGFPTITVENGYLYAGKNGGIYRWQVSVMTENTPLGNYRYTTATNPALGDNEVVRLNPKSISGVVHLVVVTNRRVHIIKDEQGTPSIVGPNALTNSNDFFINAKLTSTGDLYYLYRSGNGMTTTGNGALMVTYNAVSRTSNWALNATGISVSYGQTGIAAAQGPTTAFWRSFTNLDVTEGTSTANSGNNTMYINTDMGLVIIQENRTTPANSTISSFINSSLGTNFATTSTVRSRLDNPDGTTANTIDGGYDSYYLSNNYGGGVQDWLEYDLGSNRTFNHLRQFFWTGLQYLPTSYVVETSTQGTTTNLAPNATGLNAHGKLGAGFEADKAFDNNIGTGYISSLNISGNVTGTYWLEQVFSNPTQLSAIDLQFWENSRVARDYRLESSTQESIPLTPSSVNASSVLNNNIPSFGPNNAIDSENNSSTRWIANAVAPQWLSLDFGSTVEVSGVELLSQDSVRIPRNFTIEHSTDGNSWTTTSTVTNNQAINRRIVFDNIVNARYVRINISSTPGSPPDLIDFRAFSRMFENGTTTTLANVTDNTSIARLHTFNSTTAKAYRLISTKTVSNTLGVREFKSFQSHFANGTVNEVQTVTNLDSPTVGNIAALRDTHTRAKHFISFPNQTARYLRVRYTGAPVSQSSPLVTEFQVYNTATSDWFPSQSWRAAIGGASNSYYAVLNTAASQDGRIVRVDNVNIDQPTIAEVINKTTKPELASQEFNSIQIVDSNKMITGTTAGAAFIGKRYSNDLPTIQPNSAFNPAAVASWKTFEEDANKNGGEIYYQVSTDDGGSWLFWNGSAWVAAGPTDRNTAAEINDNVAELPIGTREFTWRAYLASNGSQEVTLNNVKVTINPDVTPPAQNADDIKMYITQNGQEIADNEWVTTNSPYFNWTAGADDSNPGATGIKGYCLYLGQDENANPETDKGILGASPLDTNNACQFTVPANALNLAVSGMLGTPLTSSTSPYYLRIKALDQSNNVFVGSAESFRFRFDNTLPNSPGFISAPSQFLATRDVTLTWPTTGSGAISDNHSGVLGLQYRIGGEGTWYGASHTGSQDRNDILPNSGSYRTDEIYDYPALIEGNNIIYFRTVDQAGNFSNVYATAVIKVNTAAPSSPRNVAASPTSNTANSFAFSWDHPESFVGPSSALQYCYTVNTLPTAFTCNFTNAGVTGIAAGPYATQPGENTFYVVAKDEAGNINYATYGSATFQANTSAPGMPINVEIADISTKATSNWKIALSWSAPEDAGAGIATYRVFRSTDNQNFTQIATTSGLSHVDGGIPQSRFYYKVRACDSANNCGAFSAVTDMYPTGKFTEPAKLVSKPTVSNVTTKRARIQWSTNRESDSKVAIGKSRGNYFASEISNSSQVTDHILDLDNLDAGTTYYFVARWTDEDGNTGVSQEISFSTAPAPFVKEVKTIKTSLNSAVIQFTSKDSTKAVINFGKTDSFGGSTEINTSLSESTYSIELPGLDDGSRYLFRVVLLDSEGGQYPGDIYSFTTPPRPRISDLRFQPVPDQPTSTQKISWRTNVPASSTITYGIVGSGGRDIQSARLTTDHELIVKDLQDDSTYFIVAQSRDAGGNLAVSERQTFKTALDTRPPKISDISVEASIKGTGAEARGQIVVSWKTDEPATSQVAYSEGNVTEDLNSKTAEDGTLSTEHIVVISDLPTSRIYSVQPIAKDGSGNAGFGDINSAIIGRASDSVITIVLNTLRRVFGF